MTPPGSESTMSSSSSAPVAVNNAVSPRHARSRTQSISSDRPSTIAHSLMSPPLPALPEAAFIAASAASQIVTNDHDSHSETWYDQNGIEPSGETALVSLGALQLANSFVDQLLFNIIAVAGSTSLSALRPAVSEVLKPKLAKDAINQADEELREYLGGGEVDELARSPATQSSRDWDLELAWKRTRLRCMVYSSLGDLEEEDEDYYMEQEHLRGESDDILTETVSPAVAIFLTSILEFMGEQVLVISGQAAFNRLRVKYEKELKDGSRSAGDVAERLVVEELDMERVALDRTLGRLWRAWKKRIRSPTEPNFSRPFSRSSAGPSSLPHTRQGSIVTVTDRTVSGALLKETSSEMEEETRSEEETKLGGDVKSKQGAEICPSTIALPMSDNDVAEIEVPGLVTYSDDERSDEEDDDDDDVIRRPTRPKSSIIFFRPSQLEPATPTMSELRTAAEFRRGRSNSLPTPAASPYKSPSPVCSNVTQPANKEQPQENLEKDEVARHAQDKVGPGAAVPVSATPEIARSGSTTTALTQNTPRTGVNEGEIDDFEEVQILTSSRISIGGRSSPSASEAGIARPPSIIIARSNSVGSARLINVQSPRSPSIGSRTGSWDADHTRSTDISREGSISTPTPPIAEEQDYVEPSEPHKRSGFIIPSNEHLDVSIVSTAPPRSRSPPKSVPPQSTVLAPAPAPTKVTILSAPTPRSSSLPENQDGPYKSSYRTPPLPSLPERNAGRQAHRQANTPPVAAVTPQRDSPESAKVQRPKLADSPASSTSKKLTAFRTSEDSSTHRPEDVARHFEELIHSDQTLQYTLTPENMRDTSSSKSSRSIKDGSPVDHRPQQSDDVKAAQRSRSSSFKRSLSLSRSAGLSSHPPTDVFVSGKHTGLGSRPPVSMPMKSRAGPVARDARVPRDSTQDFADFIRGTGPQGANAPPHRVRGGSVTTARNGNPPVAASRSTSTANRPSVSSSGSVARARLQAREATITSSSGTSELIDFIRRGPQDLNDNNPRIPRHVAPFRTTMDSDQMLMSGATGGRAIDAVLPNIRDSQASTNITETSAPSSMNSQSALLSKANKPAAYVNNFDDGDMAPKRKQRRVRDPYAIDLSDEEDDFEILPKPKPKKEESLIDFLNSYDPPPEPEPNPIKTQTLPKKKSAPNLLSRLRAGGHSSSGSFSGLSRKNSNLESRSLYSRASTTRGYTPITVNIPQGVDKFGTDFMQPPPRVPTSSSGRVPMKKFEPRDAHSSTTRTSDLADFLRDSEPPPSAIASTTSPTDEKPSGGFSRMFERRKKPTVF